MMQIPKTPPYPQMRAFKTGYSGSIQIGQTALKLGHKLIRQGKRWAGEL